MISSLTKQFYFCDIVPALVELSNAYDTPCTSAVENNFCY